MSRHWVLLTTLTALLAATSGAPVLADTSLWHWGVRGHHAVTDTVDHPGARCQYDPATRALTVIRVRPPVVRARDQTPGPDPQLVGARVWLERRVDADGAWIRAVNSGLATGIATDTTSPFGSTVSMRPQGPGDYRVFWTFSWYGPGGELVGRAIHRIDEYALRVGDVTTAHATGSCPADRGAAPSTLVAHGSRTIPRVALTFDMGGRLTPALDIMGWLIEQGVPATIFAAGVIGMTPVGTQVLELAAAHPELFVIGNHSWDHPSFIGLSGPAVAAQLNETDAAISAITGETTRPWFRPPFGSADTAVKAAVGSAGWALTVRWDVVTTDYLPQSQGGPTTAQLVVQVLSHVQNGSIVIMHLGGYQTLDALPAIVQGLRDMGLEPVTLESLLGC
jgi:peptidoglycan/xylan/chitin deacetylase (PgdA/CDA1 family)